MNELKQPLIDSIPLNSDRPENDSEFGIALFSC